MPARPNLSFSLENGSSWLEKHFSRVVRYDLATALIFPSAQPVIDYIESSRDWYETQLLAGISWETVMELWTALIVAHIAGEGDFRVSKLTGVFVCSQDE